MCRWKVLISKTSLEIVVTTIQRSVQNKIILDFGFFIQMENNYLWLSYILRPNGNHKILIQKYIDLFKADTLTNSAGSFQIN